MKDKIILIDKPANMTSFGVVARVRRKLSEELEKKVKVGHTGTLDPFATGLLILVIGKECKNASLYSKLDKEYEVTIRLGQTSTTGDPEGELTNISDKIPSKTEIEKTLDRFIGDINQKPPIFSAIKINGERAYKFARKDKKITMPSRKVKIYSINLVKYEYSDVIIKTHVSSGTYIRSLAEDIGNALGVGAYCISLRRTKVGKWSVKNTEKRFSL